MSKLQHSWILAFVFALVLATGLQAQTMQPGAIVLARVTNSVTLQDLATNAERPAASGDQISQGTVVITGADSSVILVFSNGTTINLGADSNLNIEEYLQDPFSEPVQPAQMTAEPTTSATRLNLTRGELVGDVKRLNREQGSSFIVQTPAGAAGIRGTVFRIVFRPDGTGQAFFSLTTVEGAVAFSTTGAVDAPQTVVGENQEVTVDVSVDDATGVVTVLTPVSQIAAQEASAANLAATTAVYNQLAQAVVEVVMTSAGGTVSGTPPPTNSSTSNSNTAPVVPQNLPRTTPADGQ